MTIKDIQQILTSQYPTAAKRLLNPRLNTGKLRDAFKLALPDWQQGVKRAIQEITVYQK